MASSSGRQPNFAALNRGRHLCLAGQPSGSALAHILAMAFFWDHPGELVPEENFDFMVQRKINRGRHTDHPAGRNSIWSNQCPPPPSPHFLQVGCPSCRPTNSIKALVFQLYLSDISLPFQSVQSTNLTFYSICTYTFTYQMQ